MRVFFSTFNICIENLVADLFKYDLFYPVLKLCANLVSNFHYQEFNGDRKQIQQELTISAIVGCKCRIDGDWKEYLGPLGMCTMKANESIQFSDIHGGDVEHRTHFSDWREALQKNPKQGVVKYRDKPFFTYYASVEYKDGLPWLVRVRLDFTPSKNIIIKKQNKQ